MCWRIFTHQFLYADNKQHSHTRTHSTPTHSPKNEGNQIKTVHAKPAHHSHDLFMYCVRTALGECSSKLIYSPREREKNTHAHTTGKPHARQRRWIWIILAVPEATPVRPAADSQQVNGCISIRQFSFFRCESGTLARVVFNRILLMIEQKLHTQNQTKQRIRTHTQLLIISANSRTQVGHCSSWLVSFALWRSLLFEQHN